MPRQCSAVSPYFADLFKTRNDKLELQSFQSGGFLFAEHFIGSHLHGMGLPGSHKSGGDFSCLCWEFRRVRFCVIQNLRAWGMWSSGLRKDCGIN